MTDELERDIARAAIGPSAEGIIAEHGAEVTAEVLDAQREAAPAEAAARERAMPRELVDPEAARREALASIPGGYTVPAAVATSEAVESLRDPAAVVGPGESALAAEPFRSAPTFAIPEAKTAFNRGDPSPRMPQATARAGELSSTSEPAETYPAERPATLEPVRPTQVLPATIPPIVPAVSVAVPYEQSDLARDAATFQRGLDAARAAREVRPVPASR